MKLQRTLALIKPHVFKDFSKIGADVVIADIQARYIEQGLKIIAVKSFIMDQDFAKTFYRAHIDKSFFKDILREMLSGRSFAMVLEGNKAVVKARILNGATDPRKAEVGTLRYDYGRYEKGPSNGVHGSDSPESAKREIEVVFAPLKL